MRGPLRWGRLLLERVIRDWNRWAGVPRDVVTTALLLLLAYGLSAVLLRHTGAENNSALVFVLLIMLISYLTDSYLYGVVASLLGGFFINYSFMYPYNAFSLHYAGYPLAMGSMLLISLIVSGLAARIKRLANQAVQREQRTKALYLQNQQLSEEKAAIALEAARETIRGNILRAVSHDLRTPLTAISGAAAVLLESGEILAEKNVSLLLGIKTDADSLIAMVENLLSVTCIQQDTAPLKKREELLEEVAGDAVMTIRRRFPEAEVSLELSEEILYLPMDPMLIKQVLVNLLENALRHSGSTRGIRMELLREGDWAVVRVRDRGRGLSPPVLEAIRSGRPIPQDLSGDASTGMGIGLSVCQSIIEAHGGFFSADNDPEGGAVFRFGLPLEGEEDERETTDSGGGG